MRFIKMQGAGNDYVLIDGTKEVLADEELRLFARNVSDRHFGVGSDGLIVVLPSKVANFRMRMLNVDGSEAEMCGNGIRCFAKYVFDHALHSDAVMSVETLAGIKTIKVNSSGGKMESARVDMGEPKLLRSEIPMRGNGSDKAISEPLRVSGKKLAVTCVSMGNPHCVTYVDNVDNFPVEKVGPQIENHPSFPHRTNVEFVEIISPRELKIRTWERGCGETLACGTGACASVVASILDEKSSRKVTAHLRGGELLIEWMGDNKVFLSGPAEEVFEGELSARTLKKWTSPDS